MPHKDRSSPDHVTRLFSTGYSVTYLDAQRNFRPMKGFCSSPSKSSNSTKRLLYFHSLCEGFINLVRLHSLLPQRLRPHCPPFEFQTPPCLRSWKHGGFLDCRSLPRSASSRRPACRAQMTDIAVNFSSTVTVQ